MMLCCWQGRVAAGSAVYDHYHNCQCRLTVAVASQVAALCVLCERYRRTKVRNQQNFLSINSD
jgi:hypothetical protein